MSNRLSDTKIMPVIPTDEPQGAPQRPRRPQGQRPQGDTRQYRVAGQQRRPDSRQDMRPRNPHQQGRASAPQQRRVQPPPRQRIQQPYAQQAPIRRASYQSNLPDEDRFDPFRQPQQPYYAPEFDEEPREAERPRKKKKKRRHRHHSCLSRIITGILTLVVVFFVLYSAAAWYAIKKINYSETGPRSLTVGLAEQDDEVRNILLIGSDSRDEGRGRADTIIVLSFSKHNQTMTMTSLLRDSYVSIPDHGTDKLNAAYAYGGPTLLMDTIVNNFGIPIDDYICVNFKAFVHITDALGGLKITVSDREAEAINVILESEVNRIMGDPPTDDFLPSGGTFVLSGKQALAYARIRFVGNADFERTERQRTVLDLMLNKLKHPSPTALPKILHSAMPELETNIPSTSMYLLSLQLPVKLIGYDVQKLRLPADGTFSDSTSPDGQMVLAVDFDRNHQIYLDTVTQKITPAEPEIGVEP